MKRSSIRRSIGFVILCSFSLLLGGCGCLRLPCLPLGIGPRPPVIQSRASTVIDFVQDDHLDLELRGKRAPLLDEYFDPYKPLTEEYRVARGDVLEISIFGNVDTSISEVVIAPDGKLYYMFLDGMPAVGRTLPELEQAIVEGVEALFINPEVSIIPKRILNQRYMVLGRVSKPGLYHIESSITLQQAIGDAGGVKLGGYAGTTINSANLRDSFIVREGQKLNVDFERLVYTDGQDQNVFMRPGDYVYIASSLLQEIFLIGEVTESKPIQYKDGLTLSAILAGVAGTVEGWSTRAWITKVLLIRGSLDCPQAYDIDVLQIFDGTARDVYLLPGDIVYVQKKPFKYGRELVRLAIDTFVTGFGAASGSHYGTDHWFQP